MEEKGEFEQRPEAKPAEQVPLPKAKANPTTKILCVIFALVAVGLGGYILYDKIIKGKDDAKCAKVDAQESRAEQIVKVKKIIKEVEDLLIDTSDGGYKLYKEYDGYLPYNFEGNYATSIEDAYSLSFDLLTYESYWAKIGDNTTFDKAVSAVLQKHGLKESTVTGGLYGYEGVRYYLSDDGYLCTYLTSGEPFYLQCGHTGWLTDSRKELIKTLADKYKEGESSMGDYDGVILLNASLDDVKKSKDGQYELLDGGVLDAGITFYRKGEDGEWKYFAMGQQAPSCDRYNTDELKSAFEGRTCTLADGGLGIVEK